MTHFKLNILILLLGENSLIKGNNFCSTDCVKRLKNQFDSNMIMIDTSEVYMSILE